MQAFFREWHNIDQPSASDTFADPYSLLDFLVDLHTGMAAGLPDAELEAQFAKNTRLLEQLAGQLVSVVIETLAERANEEAVAQQIKSWQEEPFLAEVVAIYEEENKTNPIDRKWVILGYQQPEKQEIAG